MPEIRFEADHDDVAVLDGYCSATGRSRTDVILGLLRKWSDDKLHEATLIMRVAGRTPVGSESDSGGTPVYRQEVQMTDLYDQATAREEEDRERAIARARSLAAALPFVGCCYNCDALVPDGHRFCDTDCRDDWQRRHEVTR